MAFIALEGPSLATVILKIKLTLEALEAEVYHSPSALRLDWNLRRQVEIFRYCTRLTFEHYVKNLLHLLNVLLEVFKLLFKHSKHMSQDFVEVSFAFSDELTTLFYILSYRR
jgi:hypothetical protein